MHDLKRWLPHHPHPGGKAFLQEKEKEWHALYSVRIALLSKKKLKKIKNKKIKEPRI